MDALTPSLENYLETIWVLSLKQRVVRTKDIAKSVSVNVASVVGAIRTLSGKGLVVHEKYGYTELTQRGVAIAKEIYEKHRILSRFFYEILGVRSETAAKDACQIEHYISKETMDRLIKFIKFTEDCPEGEPLWLSSFHYFVKHGFRPEHCGRGKKTIDGGEAMGSMKLNDLKVGQRGQVLKITADSGIKRRLLDMGMVPGVEVKVEKVAPLGDPIDVIVKGYHLSLRKEEASAVTVEMREQ
jgi:DtxR family Mn-dependent transcriptional regulator